MPSSATSTTPPIGPREPEIEFLGKVVRVGLIVLRAVTVIAALGALGYGLVHIADLDVQFQLIAPPPPESMPDSVSAADAGVPRSKPIASYFVWICIGIPPLLPIDWLFGRGRWLMLAVGAVLWFGPMWLRGDHEYGYILRFFATLVALSVLFVWKTIFALTRRTN